ncbi:MAG: PfkB family carbohydrate kinase [Armatimonadetes bacterium]|nr:PfkB family carbohydrate kinase [Armatimonadota bacterium]
MAVLTEQRLVDLLNGFPNVRVALVGDFFLDKYLDCDRTLSEVSLETGLEAFQVVRIRCYPGAAGTVASNLKALEVGEVYAVGFTGDDGEGYELRRGLKRIGVDLTHFQIRPDLMTPTYTKPMMKEPDGRWHELNRLDIKNRQPLPEDLQEQIIASVRELLPKVHAVVVSDQVQERNCGVITDKVKSTLCELAAMHTDKIFYADSRERIGEFINFAIKPNRHEAAKAVRGEWCGSVTLERAIEFGRKLFERNRKPVFVTVGEHGILVFCEDGSWHIPAVPVTGEIDIVGAGDSVTGGIVPALCLGAHPVEAATIGNIVASITIQQIGVTGTATREQVLKRFREAANAIAPRPLSS